MPWTKFSTTGTPQAWLEVDYLTLNPPSNSLWTKDAIDPQWFLDPAAMRFGARYSTSLIFYDCSWTTQLPAAAVVQEIRVKFNRFLLGGLFPQNDLQDGGLVMTIGTEQNPSTPKPNGGNYSNGQQWNAGIGGPPGTTSLDALQPAQFNMLTDEDPNDEPTNAELMNPGTGFLFYVVSLSGKLEDLNGSTGIMVSDPMLEIDYIQDV